ncbi:MAG: hypothetical protein HY037_07740, partial [Nitrospirae bacterium]|nr:hypothetical protein [Candidatus Troglogloeales bacterium]
DDYLKLAVSQQRAVVDIYPNAKCSENFMRVAHQVLQWPIPTDPKGSVQFFWRKLLAGATCPARVAPLAGVAPLSAESA